MESEDEKRTQQEIRINSTTIVIVTILGFVVSVGLYVFFVIIPLRRTEQKADAVLKSVQDTSNQVSKLVTDLENIVHDYEELKDVLEDRFQAERTLLCEGGPSLLCSGFPEVFQPECEGFIEPLLEPLCLAPLQPAITSGLNTEVSSQVTFSSNPSKRTSNTTSSSSSTGSCSSSTQEYSSTGSKYTVARYKKPSSTSSKTLPSSSAPFSSRGYRAPNSKRDSSQPKLGKSRGNAEAKYRAPERR